MKAIKFRFLWRLSISVNDEPENLMVLPPIDDDLSERIILLKSTSPVGPNTTEAK